MGQEVKASEPFDLNQELAHKYMNWQGTYLCNMLKGDDAGNDAHTAKLCCIAFMEGAKALQLLMMSAIVHEAFPDRQP
jgi:hypothetical protein